MNDWNSEQGRAQLRAHYRRHVDRLHLYVTALAAAAPGGSREAQGLRGMADGLGLLIRHAYQDVCRGVPVATRQPTQAEIDEHGLCRWVLLREGAEGE